MEPRYSSRHTPRTARVRDKWEWIAMKPATLALIPVLLLTRAMVAQTNLGEAVRIEQLAATAARPGLSARVTAAPTWYTLTTRAAAVTAWNDFAPTRNVSFGFTGNVGAGIAG